MAKKWIILRKKETFKQKINDKNRKGSNLDVDKIVKQEIKLRDR